MEQSLPNSSFRASSVVLFLFILLVPASLFSLNNQDEPGPFDPSIALKMILEMSEFDLSISVTNPPVDTSDKLSDYFSQEQNNASRGGYEYFYRMGGVLGSEVSIREYLSDYYSPARVEEFISMRLVQFPDTNGWIVFNDMIFTSQGERGIDSFLSLKWGEAEVEPIEYKNSPQGVVLITVLKLPTIIEHEEWNEQTQDIGTYEHVLHEERIDFLWHDGKWKLNTFIGTFGL